MPTAQIIVNPYAGRWKARDQIPQIETALDRVEVQYRLAVTQKPGEGIEIARAAALAGMSPIVAVGGDSTCNEVINGLMAAAGEQTTVPMGIFPLGTANDLAYGLDIPAEIEKAAEIIAEGKTRQVDVGRVNGRFFANNSAVGLEPVITLENERLVRVKGVVRYLLAALICILRRPTWEMELAWDGHSHQGPVQLVSVGNNRRTGGVFFMTPKAEMDDGLLDFVFAPVLPRLKLLRLLPRTFDGSHIQDPAVSYYRSSSLRIRCRPGTPIQTDGEVFEREAGEIVYDILGGKLTVIVPAV